MYAAYPIGFVQAILWLAASTGAQLGMARLLKDGYVHVPEGMPDFTWQVAVMLGFTFLLLGYWKFVRKAQLRTLGLRLDRLGGDLKFALIAAIAMGLVYLLLAGGYWVVLRLFFDDGQEMFRSHLRGAIFKDSSALYFVGVVIFFPILEEIWFRGLMYTPMRREWGRWPAILILSVLFAAAHNVALPINQFIGGLIFVWAYEKRQSLVAPILLHMAGNGALAVVGWALVEWQLV
ncbi:MAG: CPBP family intramembrane metalloprotease [Planctomycetes bacterium]|nr:CPBP family intramembrane metalloprotease [Planctomycetota bacterium]